MESWADTRASRGASPVADLAEAIGETFGRSFAELSRKYDRDGVFLRTWMDIFGHPSGSSARHRTFDDWVTLCLRQSQLQRQKSMMDPATVRVKSESGFSLWPPLTAEKVGNDCSLMSSGDGRTKPNKAGWAAAQLWAAVTAMLAESGPTRLRGNPCRFSRLSKTTSASGAKFLNWRLSLNPLFCAWLMGWPTEWVQFTDSKTETIRYARQAMESYLSRQRRHLSCWLQELLEWT
jgi:hypothetical protein